MSSQVIATILRHDSKVTSYKIALLRSINDVVTTFPDLRTYQQDVAVPLRLLAEFWVAYYWGFVDAHAPIMQGQQAQRDGTIRNDMSFRPALSQFRQLWEQHIGGLSNPADGFVVIHEMRSPRRSATYPPVLQSAFQQAIRAIISTLKQPIQYAGPGHWSVFAKPASYATLRDRTVAVPGTEPQDLCVVISAELWQTFQAMSLWIEALCIHEWSLFTERMAAQSCPRGDAYTLLTARPDNRRPLTWESNQVDILLLEGETFICPWTTKRIVQGVAYDLDHLLPLAVYPINELWNLVPADPSFNRHIKRDRLPSAERLFAARSALQWDYERYGLSATLSQALQEDVRLRFATVQAIGADAFAGAVADGVIDLIEQVARSRNLVRLG
jgi:hypothetical protein